MYVSPWLQAALLPRRWDVCGVVCQPLSLWHHYILRRSGNRYVCGGQAPDRDAATEVMLYASGGIEHGRALYASPEYRHVHRKAIVAKVKRHKWEFVDAAVSEYVSECARIPTHSRAVGGGDKAAKGIAAPAEWVIAEHCSGGDAGRLDAAFDTPYAVACCMFDARRNAAGDDDSLIDEDREERIDAKVEARIRLAAEKGAA